MSCSTEKLLRMTLIIYLMIGAVITGNFTGAIISARASKASALRPKNGRRLHLSPVSITGRKIF